MEVDRRKFLTLLFLLLNIWKESGCISAKNHPIVQAARLKRSVPASSPEPLLTEAEDIMYVVTENNGSELTTTLPLLLDDVRDRSRSFSAPSILIDLIGGHDSYLPEGYNKLEIPAEKPKAGTDEDDPQSQADRLKFKVWVSLTIKSVLEIDEVKETMTLQLESVISWFDNKIRTKNEPFYKWNVTKPLDIVYLDRIWHPDLYLENLVNVGTPKFIGEPVSLRIRPQMGEIFYKTRLSPTVKCQFTFVYYPADIQKCDFILRSYSYQTDELHLVWLRSVKLDETVLASFDLVKQTFGLENITEKFDTLDVTYDTLKFTLIARRKLSYHLVQTYLPSSIFIFITWLCFLLPPSMLEARMGIAMTTLLTLTAMFAAVRSGAPVVSYVKAIDVWMVVSMLFVFITLAEFATMIWIRHSYEKSQQRKSTTDAVALIINPESNDVNSNLRERPPLYVAVAKFIDKYAVVAYSLAFVAFTIVYWTWLLISSEYFATNNSNKTLEFYEILFNDTEYTQWSTEAFTLLMHQDANATEQLLSQVSQVD